MTSKNPEWLVEMEDLVKASEQAAKSPPAGPPTGKRPSVSPKKAAELAERKTPKGEPP